MKKIHLRKKWKDDEHMTVADLSDNLIMNQTINIKRI